MNSILRNSLSVNLKRLIFKVIINRIMVSPTGTSMGMTIKRIVILMRIMTMDIIISMDIAITKFIHMMMDLP